MAAYITCFVAGFAVLLIELSSFRLLAPYFGTSSYVTGIVINSILLALAVGYVAGGRAADYYLSSNLPYTVLIGSGVYLSCVYAGYPLLLDALSGTSPIGGTTFAMASMLFAPTALLGFVTPYYVRILSVQRLVGRTAGGVYAISTIGSIFGGISATFILIPSLGTRHTVLVAIILLLTVGAIGLVRKDRWSMLPVMTAVALLSVAKMPSSRDLFRQDSEYNVIRVMVDGDHKILRLNDNFGHHSQTLDSDTGLTDDYYDGFLLAQMLTNAKNTLILGNGAGTSMMQTARFFSTRLDGVEIDPKLTDIGRTFFGLQVSEQMRIIHEDARAFVNRNQLKYDVVYVDVYTGSAHVPFHLATREFYRRIRDSLSPDGVVAVNIPFYSLDSALGDLYLATIASVFTDTYISGCVAYAFTSSMPTDRLWAKLESGTLPRILTELRNDIVSRLRKVTADVAQGVFTDDDAPVEMMTVELLHRIRRSGSLTKRSNCRNPPSGR